MILWKRPGQWSALLCVLVLAACGGGGSGPGGSPTIEDVILAKAFKGQIQLPNFAAYELLDNGAPGRMVGSGQGDSNGDISLTIRDYSTRYVLLSAWGGQLNDPFAGSTVSIPAEFPICAIVDTQGDLGLRYELNFATTMVSKRTEQLARFPDIRVGEAYENADSAIQNRFGFGGMIATTGSRDVLTTQPLIDDATINGFLAAVICEFAAINLQNPFELMYLLANDVQDGALDGAYLGNELRFGNGNELGSDVWTSGLSTALDNFFASGFNVNGYTTGDTQLDELLASNEELAPTPWNLRTWPRYFERGADSTIEINGFDLPSAGDAEVWIGGLQVDAGDISDNGDGGLNVDLRFTLTDQLNLDFGLRYDLRVRNADTGQAKTERAALGLVDPNEAPQIDSFGIDYSVVDSSGGGLVKIRGLNFKSDAEVFIGDEQATIFQSSLPNTLVVVVPDVANGSLTVRVEDGGGSDSLTNALTGKSSGITTDGAGEDLRDIHFAGATYDLGANSMTMFQTDITRDDAGSGSFALDGQIASGSNPTIQPFIRSGDVFTADKGLLLEMLLNGSGYNNFSRTQFSGDVGVALGGNTTAVAIRRPTQNLDESDFAGTYYTIIQMWNFADNTARTMLGTVTLDDDGTGSLNVNCDEDDLASGDRVTTALAAGFDYSIGSFGAFDIDSALPAFPLDLSGQLSGDANTSVFIGTHGSDWMVWGVTVRYDGDGATDPVDAVGSYIGPNVRFTPGLSGISTNFGRINMALGFDRDALLGYTFDEATEAGPSDPNGTFGWKTRTPVKTLANNGLWTDRNDSVRGFFSNASGLAFSTSNKGPGFRLLANVPQVQTGWSLAGDYVSGSYTRIFRGNATETDTFAVRGAVSYT
ncbi:MAG: IPT/TIG domain-containing protein, partial [Planctomycetota bacterium]